MNEEEVESPVAPTSSVSLVVTIEFGGYTRGQHIDDPEEVAAILSSQVAHCVNKITKEIRHASDSTGKY